MFPGLQINCASIDDAVDKVKHGDAWVAVGIGKNFTMDLMTRMCSIDTESETCKIIKQFLPPTTDHDYINGSSIALHADITSKSVSIF